MQNPQLAANPLRNLEDLRSALLEIWRPLRPFFAANPAGPRIGHTAATYGDRVALLETYSRPLWAIAPFAAGGGNFPDWELYHRGIAAGTNPSHADYWGDLGNTDQRAVEMAAIGLTMALCKEKFWNPLPKAVQDRLATWIGSINERRLVGNNWLFFRILVNCGLEAVGREPNEQRIDEDLANIDRYYLQRGWFGDGMGGNRDYYIPMAFYFYGFIYSRLSNGGDPLWATRLAERARLFAPQFAAWFNADGAALPFGRSLSYRFAQGAFWGGAAYAGVEALPWGMMKRLHLQHLRWWMRQPMFTETGLLSIGYSYPNLIISDRYNAPGSPYWALKAFLPLALAPNHPFWRTPETDVPQQSILAQPEAGLILCQDVPRKHLFALGGLGAPGWDPRHGEQKYAKCTYSTEFGFGVPLGGSGPGHGGGDGTLLLSEEGRHWRGRENAQKPSVSPSGSFLRVRWKPWPDVTIDTWLAPGLPGHIRLHHIRSGRPLESFEGGFALDRTENWGSRQAKPSTAGVSTNKGFSGIMDLRSGREGAVLDASPNTNLLHALSVLPGLRGKHEPGDFWLCCSVFACPTDPEAARLQANFFSEWTAEPSDTGMRILRGQQPFLDCPAVAL